MSESIMIPFYDRVRERMALQNVGSFPLSSCFQAMGVVHIRDGTDYHIY